MFSATLYIIRCTAKNRLRRRLARLREPRYLFGAIVGVAYLYFSFFGRMQFNRRRNRARQLPLAVIPAFGGVGPVAAGLAVVAGASLSLLMPFNSALLVFSRTESEFLFPSPLSHRQLLLYRLLRTQWGMIFGALIVSLTYPLATPGARLRAFIGVWVALMTAQAFFSGVSLTRATIARPSWRAWIVSRLPRVWMGITITVVAVASFLRMEERNMAVDSAMAVFRLVTEASMDGWPRVVLWPFMAVLAPLFAESWPQFAVALAGALFVYLLNVAWVLSADEAFDAVTDTLVETQQKAGRARIVYSARKMLWPLALEGRPETLFIWKTMTQAMRAISRRLLIRMLIVVGWISLLLVLIAARARGITQIGGIFAAVGAAFAVIFGPQIVRLDLRQDLQHLELLKTWPLRATAVIRGQMMGSAAVITVVAWALGLLALLLSTAAFPRVGAEWRTAIGLSALILAPPLVLAQYTVHNAAALFFPAWIASGSTRPRGIDAMGQRMIMLGGTWIVLLIAIIPSAIITAVFWFAFGRLIGPWVFVPASLISAVLILFEVGMATEALGPAYERLDVTSVERGE